MVRRGFGESLAVGSQSFVMRACQAHANRRKFDVSEVSGSTGPLWAVREEPCSHTTVSTPKKTV